MLSRVSSRILARSSCGLPGRPTSQRTERRLPKRRARLASSIEQLPFVDNLDRLRGVEGEAARQHFGSFSHMIREERETFALNGRNRRPPRDPTNALLSFLYALLLTDCVAAVEGVGLDPQMGFLHALRPGRPALGLDLMEELRPVIAERLVLSLINRRQISARHFVNRPGGAVHLSEEGRKKVIVAYQKRKQEELQHPLLEQKIPIGLVPHAQARLLARTLPQGIWSIICPLCIARRFVHGGSDHVRRGNR